METTPPTTESTASETVSGPVIGFRRIIGLLLISLIGWVTVSIPEFIENLEGGPVHTAGEYRERDTQTRQAGKREVGRLGPRVGDPYVGDANSESCGDGLGDDVGVSSDRPTYEWNLSFPDRDAYLTQLKELRASWENRGWKVRDVAARDSGPGKGLPGIKTADPDGITITVAPDWYSDDVVLRTDGSCIRHHTDLKADFLNGSSGSYEPVRTGSVAYSDGVNVSAGPVHPFTPSAKTTGYSPGTHAYRVAVTITNGSDLTLNLSEGRSWGTDGGFIGNRVKDPLLPTCPQKLRPGKSASCEFAFSTEKEISTLAFDFSPSQFHETAMWNLTTK
ncbi:hypothetical protein [Streptomyces sp. NPDC002537]